MGELEKIELKKELHKQMADNTPSRARGLIMRAIDNGIITGLSVEQKQENSLIDSFMQGDKISLGGY